MEVNNKNTDKQNYLEKTQEFAKKLKLPMKIFKFEKKIEENKLIFYFTADNRVDFRELVKLLATEFKKRIELRQVGPRDEFKLCGSIGICGKTCCCNKNFGDIEHVTIKMAKNQGLSLMPNNITGACGKLLCCLSYENEEYERLCKEMPKINSVVETPLGKGFVIFNNLIKKTCQVKINDEIKTFSVDEINKDNEKDEC